MDKKNHDVTQILLIHWGMVFKSRKDYLSFLRTYKISFEDKVRWHAKRLDDKLWRKFKVIRPLMPSPDQARYEDRKITFERYLKLLKPNSIIMGNSLWGTFLAKYFAENKISKKILSIYLIAAPHRSDNKDPDMAGWFKLPKSLTKLDKAGKYIHLIFSEDDIVVPLSHAEKYKKQLKNATLTICKNMNWHFKVSELPQIVKLIKEDIKK